MNCISYSVPRELSSPKFAEAWAKGCGGRVECENILRPGPVAMFGSPSRWDLLHQAIAEGRDWYYADHGYFNRGIYFRITRNGFQYCGKPSCGAAADYERLDSLGIPIQPWRKDGEFILVCPPDKEFAKLKGFDAEKWKDHVIKALGILTRRPIRVRERASANTTSLAEVLAEAWCLVTYVSNAAVEAICAGVPAICLGPCAASPMSSSDLQDISDPPRPRGRGAWAAILAANQWTLAEITSGMAWRAIGRPA